MLLENLSYTDSDEKVIKLKKNGKTRFVPVSDSNDDYLAIQKQIADGTIDEIVSYTSPKATMEDYRDVRNADMDEVDTKKANASRYARMSDADKALVDTWHDKMADSTTDQSIIDAVALLDQDDKEGLIALLVTKPAIIS